MKNSDELFELPEEFQFLSDDPDFYDPNDEDANWNDLAIRCMTNYFTDQKFHCGGSIPPKMLFSDRNIRLVRDYVRKNKTEGFNTLVDMMFEVLHNCSPLRFDEADVHKPWDVATLVMLFKKIHHYSVPKEFVPGMILLHFKFCKGYEVPINCLEL